MYGGHIKSGSATSLSVAGAVGTTSVSHSGSSSGGGHHHHVGAMAGGNAGGGPTHGVAHSALPFTGFESLELALISLALVIGGLLLMRMVMLISSDH